MKVECRGQCGANLGYFPTNSEVCPRRENISFSRLEGCFLRSLNYFATFCTQSYNTGKFKRGGKWGTKGQSGNSFESLDDDSNSDDFGHEVSDKRETVLKENEMPLIQSLIP